MPEIQEICKECSCRYGKLQQNTHYALIEQSLHLIEHAVYLDTDQKLSFTYACKFVYK